jgi:sugar-specific transcriptional regulator TrmB
MPDVTLRELIEERLNSIDYRIGELKSAIEKLTAGAVQEERFKSTVHKVEKLQDLVAQLDDRVDEAESQIRIYKYIGSVVVGIVAVVVAALVKSWLGL